MQRIDRYREVVKQMLDAGLAYPCYMSEEELNKAISDLVDMYHKAHRGEVDFDTSLEKWVLKI